MARLEAGNRRYVDGVAKRHDFLAEREALVGGQNPFAGILNCADSRVAPEYAFDTSRGDLFVVRVAGNFVNTDNLASFEYAVAVLKTPLILVLGHEACGAVKAAISAVKDNASFPGHIQDLTTALAPAVKAVLDRPGDLLENATIENVRQNVAALKAATPVLSAAVADKRIAVAGGIYRLATGKVDISPKQGERGGDVRPGYGSRQRAMRCTCWRNMSSTGAIGRARSLAFRSNGAISMSPMRSSSCSASSPPI